MTGLKPLVECPDLGQIKVLLTDVDGTLTRAGQIPGKVIEALEALATAGIQVIPVTGRPAGWAHMMLHHWPVKAAIAENGAIAFVRSGDEIEEVLALGDVGSVAHQAEAFEIAAQALNAVPNAVLAADQPYRRVDVAIDHGENVTALSPAELDKLVATIVALGAKVTISSIHVHVQIKDFDKATMAKRVLADYLSITDLNHALVVGDAPNDGPLFAAFSNSVGVSNIKEFADAMQNLPRWITQGAEADGFCELATRLLAARK